VRGLAEVILLESIQKITKKPITETFDWISGTSTGGLLTLNLLQGCLYCVILSLTFCAIQSKTELGIIT
jgi:hypothetical protein